MDSVGVLVPFASLIVGWYLNEISKKFQMSRERRARIGRALSNLLELRHQIRSVENTIHLLMQRFDVPKGQEVVLRTVLNQLIPQGDKYVKQYEEAIEQLSESDPIVAFDLRNKAQIPSFLSALRTTAMHQGLAGKDLSAIENLLSEMLIPSLEVAIKELATLHGRRTMQQVNRIVSTPIDIPNEVNDFLQKAKSMETNSIDSRPPN